MNYQKKKIQEQKMMEILEEKENLMNLRNDIKMLSQSNS